MIDAHSLPAGEQTVSVYALPTGHLQLPDRWLFEDASEDLLHDRQYSPDFSFLIKHPRGKILFDLGLRKVRGLSLIYCLVAQQLKLVYHRISRTTLKPLRTSTL